MTGVYQTAARLLVVSLAIAFATCVPGQEGTWPTPLQVSLSVPLQSYRLKAGAPVFASVVAAWQSPECALKPGSMVSGRVTEAHAAGKGQPEASISLSFDRADCEGRREAPIHFRLFALINAVENDDGPKDASALYGATSSRVGLGKAGAATSAAYMANQNNGRYDETRALAAPIPKNIARGEVLGAGKVRLDVGTGSQTASTLSSKRDFSIFPRAELVLFAAREEMSAIVAKSEAPVPAPAASPRVETRPEERPREQPDASEVCSEGACSNAGTEMHATEADALREISLQQVGYHPRKYSELYRFDHDTTVNFLSTRLVLVTFDLHRLRERGSWPPLVRRTVRAVLLDAETGAVKRMVDWNVDGDGQYVWDGGGGRILLHTNGELHELGPDLRTRLTLPAPGSLLWVAASPSGRRVAVGLLRERHTQNVHRLIDELSSSEPEEDVLINVFGEAGNLVSTSVRSSREPRPLLLDDGSWVQVEQEGREHWRVEARLDADRKTLAKVHSSCRPTVTLPSASAMFVVGCSSVRGRWFRLLHQDGRTFVRSTASTQQLGYRAVPNGAEAYGLGFIRTNQSIDPEKPFSSRDIKDEEIAVYAASDGHLITVKRLRSFPQVQEGFAPSKDGTRLAVLTESGVALYAVPISSTGGAKVADERGPSR